MTNVAVFGVYSTRTIAERAVERLKLEGFDMTDISVLFASPSDTNALAHQNTTKAPEGAATGGISGATVGGVLGWLAGIGSLAIPGVGPLIAAGPIMAMLAGIGVGGALGGIAGGLVGLGVPEYEAIRYEGHINSGGVLLSVHTTDSTWRQKAIEVLELTGADDISSKEELDDESSSERRKIVNM